MSEPTFTTESRPSAPSRRIQARTGSIRTDAPHWASLWMDEDVLPELGVKLQTQLSTPLTWSLEGMQSLLAIWEAEMLTLFQTYGNFGKLSLQPQDPQCTKGFLWSDSSTPAFFILDLLLWLTEETIQLLQVFLVHRGVRGHQLAEFGPSLNSEVDVASSGGHENRQAQNEATGVPAGLRKCLHWFSFQDPYQTFGHQL